MANSTFTIEDGMSDQETRFSSIETLVAQLMDPAANGLTAGNQMEYLQDVWAKCGDTHLTLERMATKEDRSTQPYFKEKQFATLELVVLDAVGAAKRFIYGDPVPPPHSSHAADRIQIASFARENVQRESCVKVPRINLPIFSGSYTEWPSFNEYIESLFPSVQYNNLERLHYLKACLNGEASKLIRNIPSTGEYFAIAWQKLESRYANKTSLINAHLDCLFAIKPIQSNSSVLLRSLINKYTDVVDALKNAGRPTEQWDDLLVYMVTHRIDRETREAWELEATDRNRPSTFAELKAFLDRRIRAVEAAGSAAEKTRASKSAPKVQMHHVDASPSQCVMCPEHHALYKCKQFSLLSIPRRWETAKKFKLCFNCLTSLHSGKACGSTRKCMYCNKEHHSLLHNKVNTKSSTSNSNAESSPNPSSNSRGHSEQSDAFDPVVIAQHASNGVRSEILLATARVCVEAGSRVIVARALLDSRSTHTAALVKALHARTFPTCAQVQVIGGDISRRGTRTAQMLLKPIGQSEPVFKFEPFIIETLTSYKPQAHLPLSDWSHLEGIELSDTATVVETPIHLLVGADLYPYLLRDGLRLGMMGEPVAQNTVFGWVLFGQTSTVPVPAEPTVFANHIDSLSDLTRAISRFWEIEEVNPCFPPSEDDVRCELHFRRSYSRTFKGRYVVRLPFKQPPPIGIGNSRLRAERQFNALEKRLLRSPEDRQEYCAFMREYENLGHMSRANLPVDSSQVYYLPHHPVVKQTSTTTKVRVVFNASSPTSNASSLNDHLLVGPKLQLDLPTLLTRWRFHRFVYCGDIAKMFRQILIDERYLDYQRILWRENASDQLYEYTLRTVTYGMASAPFLAQRVLKHLADDDGHLFPAAKPILASQVYVNDCLFGGDDQASTREQRDQLIALLRRGGFEIRKWASNCPELLNDIDPANHGLAVEKRLQPDDSLKILGVVWSPLSDEYRFSVHLEEHTQLTKRIVLSLIARLFDPLGWLSPIIVTAKIIMQSLTKMALEWDDPIPESVSTTWTNYYDSLSAVNFIAIPRWLRFGIKVESVELHGFSDASNLAYAAVFYARVTSLSGEVSVHLVASKSRIAPEKKLTIPRLELIGALLLARLLSKFRSVKEFEGCPVQCWTDATIILAWLSKQSSHWKTFVANRVSEIHSLLDGVAWDHVAAESNPADLASRGMSAQALGNSELWWFGPPWLRQPKAEWPVSVPEPPEQSIMEVNHSTLQTLVQMENTLAFTKRFSEWTRLLRVTALILNWLPLLRRKFPCGLKPTAIADSAVLRGTQSTDGPQSKFKRVPPL